MGFERITVDPDRMGGVPCLPPEILAEHPDLEAEDIEAALRYAAEAVLERELPLRRGA